MKRVKHYVYNANEPTTCYYCCKTLGDHRWEVYLGTQRKVTCSEQHAHLAYDERKQNEYRIAKELHLV